MSIRQYRSFVLVIALFAIFGATTLVIGLQTTTCTNNFAHTVTAPAHRMDDALDGGLTVTEAAVLMDLLQRVERAGDEYRVRCFEQSYDVMPSTTAQVRGLPQPTFQQTANPIPPTFTNCPAVGSSSSGSLDQEHQELNLKKNRTDLPPDDIYQPVSFQTLVELPWSAPAEQQRTFAEGFPVAIEGYLGWVESQSGESNNCTSGQSLSKAGCDRPTAHHPENVDFHIWLLDYPVVGLDHSTPTFAQSALGHARADAIIVETTPRVRIPNHLATWTVARLCDFVFQGTRVRISGWTLLDTEHPTNVGETRATLWEIYPVMRIEFWDGQQWTELS